MINTIKQFVHSFAVWAVGLLGLGETFANYVYILFVSLLPVVELRGAIPVAFALKMPLVPSVLLSIAGNLLPVPFILWLITPFCNWLKRTRAFAWFPRFLEKKVDKKKEQVTKYAFWGLCLFVAIPLPGTGAWTGALIASFLNFKFKDALISIVLGVIIAAIFVSLATYGVLGLIF